MKRLATIAPRCPGSTFCFLLFGLIALFLTAGCGPEVPEKKLRRIILISNGDAPFWDACSSGVNDAEKKFKLREAGLSAEFVKNDGKVSGQIKLLEQYLTQNDVAAIGISVIEPDNSTLAELMKKLRDKGVKVITVDSDIDSKKYPEARRYYIGTNNRIGGNVLGICAKNMLPGGGNYATFVGYKGAQNAIDRIEGFAEGAGDKFKSIDSREDNLIYKTAVDNVRNVLIDNDNLQMIVGIYAYNGPAAVDVVKERNSREKYKIVTFDADPRSISRMEDGMIDAMVVQDPYHMGYHGVRILKALIEDDKATIDELKKELKPASGAEDVFDTPLKVVVPDSGSPLKKEMFPANVQFLKLSEFKKWLEEYGLKGS